MYSAVVFQDRILTPLTYAENIVGILIVPVWGFLIYDICMGITETPLIYRCRTFLLL